MNEGAGAAVERYMLHGVIGRGGFATVHLGTSIGDSGAKRPVAIKRLHEGLAKNEQVIASLMDEARITSRIFHPNVVGTLEVVATKDDLYVVMEYVEGEPLSRLLGALSIRRERIPVPIVAAIVIGALRGLHAAHEACDERGAPLGIIHRDVSPQNIMVGTDGLAHLIDFGTAKAVGRIAETREGQIKGKLSYMPPEQLHGDELDRRVDVYSAGVVLWEALTGARLFRGKTDLETIAWIKEARVTVPSARVSGVSAELDAVVMRAVATERDARFPTAAAMADALAAATHVASVEEVAAWARVEAADALAERKHLVDVPAAKSAASTLTSSGGSAIVYEASVPSRPIAPVGITPAVPRARARAGRHVALAVVVVLVVVALAAFASLRACGHAQATPDGAAHDVR